MEFLLYFHEKEMLKQKRLCEKFYRQKIDRNVVAYLVAAMILRSTVIKLEVLESNLRLLMKSNILKAGNYSRG